MNEDDGLRSALAEALRGKQWVRKVMDDGYTSLLQADEFDLADAVLPIVTDWAEQQARERAAEVVHKLARSLPPTQDREANRLHDAADALTRPDRGRC